MSLGKRKNDFGDGDNPLKKRKICKIPNHEEATNNIKVYYQTEFKSKIANLIEQETKQGNSEICLYNCDNKDDAEYIRNLIFGWLKHYKYRSYELDFFDISDEDDEYKNWNVILNVTRPKIKDVLNI